MSARHKVLRHHHRLRIGSRNNVKVIFIALCLNYCVSASHAALPKKDRDSQRKGPSSAPLSISSSKTKSAIRSEEKRDDTWNKSRRMDQQPSIAEHLFASIGNDESNEFANRLLERVKEPKGSHPHARIVWYGILTMALASAFLTPTVFVDTAWTSLVVVCTLLVPWMWVGSLSRYRETALMSLASAVQLVPKDSVTRRFESVLPMALEMLADHAYYRGMETHLERRRKRH